MVLLIPTMVEFHDAPDEAIKADEAKEDFSVGELFATYYRA